MSYAGFNVIQWMLPKNKWTRPGTIITPSGLVIHWTGNIGTGANAKANSNFFHNRSGSYGSAHYVLDANEIYQVLPENEMGYHVGATKYYTTNFGTYPNKHLIGLEVCVNSDTDWTKTYDRAVRFAAAILKSRGWTDPKKVLVRHYDVTRKDCPLMWTPLVNNAAHVRSSVISMLKKRDGESATAYEARIQAGIKWVKSMTANGKLGDDGWNQFVADVGSALKGTYKTGSASKPPQTIEDKVVYYMGKFFADVNDESWKAAGINKLAATKGPDGKPIYAGDVDSKGNKVARPDDNITRAETAILISRAIEYAIAESKK